MIWDPISVAIIDQQSPYEEVNNQLMRPTLNAETYLNLQTHQSENSYLCLYYSGEYCPESELEG